MNVIENPVLKKIWEDRYRKNGESLEGTYRRVAHYVAEDENQEDRFFAVMRDGLFYPAGRTMSNAGIGENLTLNNCFVAPQVPDDLGAIFDTIKLGAITHKAGGGIGYDFSAIRPNGMPTSNDAVASGAVSFMEVFDAQTSTILQGNRRGANMGIMNVYHPDIETFITAKQTEGKLTHFNLSVMVDNDFVNAVIKNENIFLHFPVYDEKGDIIKEPSSWKVKKEVNAKELWDKIVRLAYDNGEPGIFFYDNMNKDNPLYYTERIICTNPCSEYLAGTVFGIDSQNFGGACNLGSLMLHNFVKKGFTAEAYIDHKLLEATVNIAVEMLDRIIDINKFPHKIYENYQKHFRTIGLGVTGLADALVMLDMRYDTEEARKFTSTLMEEISFYAYQASEKLAETKGRFAGFKLDYLDNGWLTKHLNKPSEFDWKSLIEKIHKHGLRNAKIMSVAPTGTMSLTFGNNCSSGIEPIFSLEYERKVKFGGQNEANTEVVKVRDYAYNKWLAFKDDPRCIVNKDKFITALDMSVNDHVDMLSAIAYNVDMSVSKTINIPTDYSFEDTKEVYMRCWKQGIKGCTIFRPNAIRQGVLIAENKSTKSKNAIPYETSLLPRGVIINCSDDLIGKKRKLQTGCGSLHVMAWFDPVNGEMQEVYLSKGSTGGCNNYMIGLSRMISLLCRAGVDIYTIKDQLDSTGVCPSYAVRSATRHDTSKGSCCAMAIGNALVEMYEETQNDIDIECEAEFEEMYPPKDDIQQDDETIAHTKCPQCGEEVRYEGGCILCPSCGWSKCD